MFILRRRRWTSARYRFAETQAIILQCARHMGQMQNTKCSTHPYYYVRKMVGAASMFGLYIPRWPTDYQYQVMLDSYKKIGMLSDKCKKIAMYHQDADYFWHDLKKIKLAGNWDDDTVASLKYYHEYLSENYALDSENFPSPNHLDNYFEQRFDVDKLIAKAGWLGITQFRFYKKGYLFKVFSYGPPEKRFLFGTRPSDVQKSEGVVTCSVKDRITIKTQMDQLTTMLCYTH